MSTGAITVASALSSAATATTATAAAVTPTAAESYPIDVWGLVITVVLVAIAAGMSIVVRLGVGRQMLWATLRSLIQLLAMGYVIKFVIEANNPWLMFALVAVKFTLNGTALPANPETSNSTAACAGAAANAIAIADAAANFLIIDMLPSSPPFDGPTGAIRAASQIER